MSALKSHITALIEAAEPGQVWVPTDFAQLGSRDAVDKTLQRMVHAGELRRIDRGLYDRPKINSLTKRPTTPDYRAVVEAIARRDHLRMLVDGMTAANDLGLTDAVPARVTIHTDTRRRTIQLDKLSIDFKQTSPSRLYWAGHPAMRIVQALYWLKASIRAKVEHPFRVIKCQFGFTKVRYRGLMKNTAQLITLFALSNLWMARRHLLGVTG